MCETMPTTLSAGAVGFRKSLTAGDLAPIGRAVSPAVAGREEKRPHGDSNPGLQDENLIS